MLLTSSQISVAVSSGIVILCTFALFLSGYVIQQRTLRQLQKSIREPKPEPPKIFLPDRFKKMTTELPDGTIITIDDGADNNIAIDGLIAPSRSEESPAVGSKADVLVKVIPSVAGNEDEVQRQLAKEGGLPEKEPTSGDPAGLINPQSDTQENIDPSLILQGKAETSGTKQKPISKAERRRLIKEELLRLAYGDKPLYYQRRLY